jgi:hypothetical protein
MPGDAASFAQYAAGLLDEALRRASQAKPWEADWKSPPAGVEDFCRDFMGKPLHPGPQAEFCRALWGADGASWRGGSRVSEAYAFWGKGSGKDTVNDIGVFTYAAYKLTNMRDPWRFFGKPQGDAIDLINVSFNARQAKNVFFKKLKASMRRCKDPLTGRNWFEQAGMDLSDGGGFLQDRQIFLDAERLLTIHSGDSLEYTGEGLNVLLALFDELGAFPSVERAVALHAALLGTMLTRFGDQGCVAALSFKYADDDAMDYLYSQAAKAEAEGRAYRSRAATWEVNPAVTRESLAGHYAKNPERAKRTFECAGEGSEGGFFSRRGEVRGRVDASWPCPVRGGMASWAGDPSMLPLEDWFKGLQGVRYHLHADLATGREGRDKCGIALCHAFTARSKWSPGYLESIGRPDLSLEAAPQPAVAVDLAVQLRSPSGGGEIQFALVAELIRRLRDERGFQFGVSYDGWQSLGELQRLQALGFKAGTLSVDRTPGPAELAKELLYSGRLRYYNNMVLLREAEELVYSKSGKVDHPERSRRREVEEGEPLGSKDVWDCVAACCHALAGGWEPESAPQTVAIESSFA